MAAVRANCRVRARVGPTLIESKTVIRFLLGRASCRKTGAHFSGSTLEGRNYGAGEAGAAIVGMLRQPPKAPVAGNADHVATGKYEAFA